MSAGVIAESSRRSRPGRALLQQSLAHEELEHPPRPTPRIEHPVHLPFAEHARIRTSGPRPLGESRQMAQAERECRALVDRPLEPLLPHRHVESGLAERVCERSERVPVERLGRDEPAVRVDVPGRGCPAELLTELPKAAEQLLLGREPPRDEPGGAFGPVPAPEALDHCLRMDGGLRVG